MNVKQGLTLKRLLAIVAFVALSATACGGSDGSDAAGSGGSGSSAGDSSGEACDLISDAMAQELFGPNVTVEDRNDVLSPSYLSECTWSDDDGAQLFILTVDIFPADFWGSPGASSDIPRQPSAVGDGVFIRSSRFLKDIEIERSDFDYGATMNSFSDYSDEEWIALLEKVAAEIVSNIE